MDDHPISIDYNILCQILIKWMCCLFHYLFNVLNLVYTSFYNDNELLESVSFGGNVWQSRLGTMDTC